MMLALTTMRTLAIKMISFLGSSDEASCRAASLPALPVWVGGLCNIERRTPLHVRDRERRGVHHARHAREIGIADVLRFVGHLVVVEMLAARHRQRRDVVPRVAVMIGATVILKWMAGRVVGVVEHEGHWLARVRRFHRVAELARDPFRADDLEIRRPPRAGPAPWESVGVPRPTMS